MGLDLLHQFQLGVLFDGQAFLHVLDLGREVGQVGGVANAPTHELPVAVPHLGAVALHLALARAQAQRHLTLAGAGLLQAGSRLLQARVAGERRLQLSDLAVEVLHPLVDAGVAQQQLASVHCGRGLTTSTV